MGFKNSTYVSESVTDTDEIALDEDDEEMDDASESFRRRGIKFESQKSCFQRQIFLKILDKLESSRGEATMWKSIVYVVKENLTNLYRIYSISKYELLADMRDSKFGIFWNFASPAIQVFTYWLVFGVAWGRSAQTYRGVTVPYLPC